MSNPSVNLAYAGKSYVSISGSAQFIDDLERKKEYWNPVFDKLLNTTYDDPNVILIKVTAETAEYWESGNAMKNVKNFAKKLTGNETQKDKKPELFIPSSKGMVLAKSRLDFRSFERMVFIFFLDTVFSEFSSENYPFWADFSLGINPDFKNVSNEQVILSVIFEFGQAPSKRSLDRQNLKII